MSDASINGLGGSVRGMGSSHNPHSPTGMMGRVTAASKRGINPSALTGPVSSHPTSGTQSRFTLKPTGSHPIASGTESRFTLEKVDTVAKGRLGMQSGGTFLAHKLSSNNQQRWDDAFQGLKSLMQPSYPQMKYLKVDLTNLTLTVYKNATDPGTPLSFDDVRKKIGQDTGRADVYQEFDQLFTEMRDVASMEGLTSIWPYSSRGEDARGNVIGGVAMTSPLVTVQNRQVRDLQDAVGNKHCLKSLIEHAGNSPAFRTPAMKSKIPERIAHAEAFLLELRSQITLEIPKLQTMISAATTSKKSKAKLKKRKDELELLLKQLTTQTHRHAYYYAAVFAKNRGTDLTKADQCYKAVCQDLYNAHIETIDDPQQRPTFAEFMSSQEGIHAKEYAADVASTLLAGAGDYKKFCGIHGVHAKQDHVNVFLIQALQNKKTIKYNDISISSDRDTKTLLNKIIKTADSRSRKAIYGTSSSIAETDSLKRIEAYRKHSATEAALKDSHVDHSWRGPAARAIKGTLKSIFKG